MAMKLMIDCPQCDAGDSRFFREHKITCGYCGGCKKVDILEHHKALNIVDERSENVRSFVEDERFVEYLMAKTKKR